MKLEEKEKGGGKATATRRQAYIAESWREFVCTRLAGGQSLFGSEDELLRLCVDDHWDFNASTNFCSGTVFFNLS